MTITFLIVLAGLIVLLVWQSQKRQLSYQMELDSLRYNYDKNLLKTQVEIQEQTFHDISREIHDNINLSLTLAKLNLNTLDLNDTETASKSIRSSINIIGAAIGDLSDLSKSINPELIRNLGLTKAVTMEVQKIESMAHLDIDFSIVGEPIFMEGERELVLFRIIQESFNNIIKHSRAAKLWLQLDFLKSELKVSIRDNGIGFIKDAISPVQNGTQSGLRNIFTRAKMINGQVNLETSPGNGTTLVITIPYQ